MAEIPINIAFDDELHSKYVKEYEAGNFTGAVKTAILFLTECIRGRTDLKLDGDKLITQALSLKCPLIRLNGLSTESEINEQTGHMMILQGLYKGIRNPRNHNLKADDRFTCDSILILVNYYVQMIKKAKLFFDFDEIMSIVDDMHFDRSTEYSEEIVRTIPKNKVFDTLLNLLLNINNQNFLNVAYLIRSGKQLLEEEEMNKFYDHCSALLQKTSDHSQIKALVFALNDTWAKVRKASRIRIEGMLIEALKNVRFDEDQCVDDHGNFYTNYTLNEDGKLAEYLRFIPIPYTKSIPPQFIHYSIKSKLELGGSYVEYLMINFHQFLFKDHYYLNSIYNDAVIKLLGQGDTALYETLTSCSCSGDDYDPDYDYDDSVTKAIKKYEQMQQKATVMDDDVPF